MTLIDPSIDAFYSQSGEDTRLTIGLGPLEFERNKELILRYLPAGKCMVADIGGGAGHYAQWLASPGAPCNTDRPRPQAHSPGRAAFQTRQAF